MAYLHQPVEVRRALPIRDLHRVLIMQNQRLLGDALEVLFNAQPDMIVIEKLDCEDGSGIRASSLNPDIVVIDFCTNAPAAMLVAKELRTSRCDAALIILTRGSVEKATQNAIEAGASAIISEHDTSERVVEAMRQAARGISLIPPSVIASALRNRRQTAWPKGQLTKRESEVLRSLAAGETSRQIAINLGITYPTVRTHVRNLAGKLTAHSKVEVVAKAYQLDLVADRSSA